jgi:hypothetical protein
VASQFSTRGRFPGSICWTISTTGFLTFRGPTRWRRVLALAAPLSSSSDTRVAVAQSPTARRASLRTSGRCASASDAEPHAADNEEALDASTLAFPFPLYVLFGRDVSIEVGSVEVDLSWAEKRPSVGVPGIEEAS